MVVEAGKNFLDVANTYCSSCRGLERGASRKSQVRSIAEGDPLIVGKKVTENTIAIGDLGSRKVSTVAFVSRN
jgi:hypothetical protein